MSDIIKKEKDEIGNSPVYDWDFSEIYKRISFDEFENPDFEFAYKIYKETKKYLRLKAELYNHDAFKK